MPLLTRRIATAGLVLATLTAPVAGAMAANAAPLPVHSTKARTVLSIWATHATVTAAGKYRDTFTGVLLAAGKPVSGVDVSLLRRRTGSHAWTRIAGVRATGSAGRISYTVTQTAASEQYMLTFAGTKHDASAHSRVVTIRKG